MVKNEYISTALFEDVCGGTAAPDHKVFPVVAFAVDGNVIALLVAFVPVALAVT